MPICRRPRSVLVVSHDLDGFTAFRLPYLATPPARLVAASPRPPLGPAPFALCRLSPVSRRRLSTDSALPRASPVTRRSLVWAGLPIMGFIEFLDLPPSGLRRSALRLSSAISVLSMHSCPSEPSLPAVASAHPSSSPSMHLGPWSPSDSSAWLPAARFTHLHAPLAVVSLPWASPASLAITRSRRGGLSTTHARLPSLHRLRAAASRAVQQRVSAPLSARLDLRVLPQAADRPVSSASSEDESSDASGALPGLVLSAWSGPFASSAGAA